MKIVLLTGLLVAVIATAFYSVDTTHNGEGLRGLPWQIELQADGGTKVFGLHLGASRLSEAVDILGDDMELAIVAAPDEAGKLEMYYGQYRAGLLSGKMVLFTNVSDDTIKRWRENAVKSEYMSSGKAKKYILSGKDRVSALDEVVVGVTFIPGVNLEEDVILARFGEPTERKVLPGVTHFIYAETGLDIALHENAKEVLQYVVPSDNR